MRQRTIHTRSQTGSLLPRSADNGHPAPAGKKTALKSESDDVIPIAESRLLVQASGLPESALVVVGADHRLADAEPLAAMLRAVNSSAQIL